MSLIYSLRSAARCLLVVCWAVSPLFSQTLTPFERDPERNTSATYAETIELYAGLAAAHADRFQPYGATDSGHPLHAGVLSADGTFDPEAARAAGKLVLLVNNGIHAGEPRGVDATQLLVRDYLERPAEFPLSDQRARS